MDSGLGLCEFFGENESIIRTRNGARRRKLSLNGDVDVKENFSCLRFHRGRGAASGTDEMSFPLRSAMKQKRDEEEKNSRAVERESEMIRMRNAVVSQVEALSRPRCDWPPTKMWKNANDIIMRFEITFS